MVRMIQVVAVAVVALGITASTSAFADTPADKGAPAQWTLQVDPLTTALGFVHLQVERRFTDHFSIYAGPHLRLFSPPFTEPEKFTGYGAEVGFRYYFLGGAPKGWWLLARGVIAQLHAKIDGVDETSGGGYISALGGYTFIISDWFVLSLGAGVQYLDYTIADMGPSGVLPAAHTAVGIAF